MGQAFRHFNVTPKMAAGAVRELMATLKSRRSNAGLSLTTMAEERGLERGFITKLEGAADQNPTVATLFRYATPLGVPIALRPETVKGKAKSKRQAKEAAHPK